MDIVKVKNKEKLRKQLLDILTFVSKNNFIYMLPPDGALGRNKYELFNALFEELTYVKKDEIACFYVSLFFNCKTNILGEFTSNNIVFPAFLIKSVHISGSYITIKLNNCMTIESHERQTEIYYEPSKNMAVT